MAEPLTVTQLNTRVRALLSSTPDVRDIWVSGEISNLTRASSGHYYFVLKDATGEVRCALFARARSRVDFEPRENMKVLAFGSADLYIQRGSYQFIVENMRRSGIGELYQAYVELKNRLEKEGLFDPVRKKPLPRYPRRIGVVTSETGAVIHDIITTSASRFPADIILAPARPDFFMYRLLGTSFSMELINVDISAQFFVHLKASLAAGCILAFPYLVWEAWRFVAPALYASEKRAVRRTFALSSLLFYVGAAVGYFIILPLCLQFFMNYSVSPDISNTVTLRSYMSMFSSMVLLMGIAFEFPSAILLLSMLGVIDKELLKRGRKYAFVLYEMSISLCSSRMKS